MATPIAIEYDPIYFSTNALGQLTLTAIGAAGVDSLNALFGVLTISNALNGAISVSAASQTISLNVVVDGATLKIASGQVQIDLTNSNVWTNQTLTAPILTTVFNNTAQNTLTGTSAGSVVSSMPEHGSAIRIFIAHSIGYENTTNTAQYIVFPVNFAYTPTIAVNDTGMALTVSTSALTFQKNMTAPATGNILIVGF